MFRNIISYLILSLILISCSGISIISKDPKDLYRADFTAKVEQVKVAYRQGNFAEASAKLKSIDEQALLPAEKGMKRNLMGVLFFEQENFEQAIYNFELALANSSLDRSLTAQVNLNLGSSYFKLGFMEKAYYYLNRCEFKNLSEREALNYHKLNYQVAKDQEKNREAMVALVNILKNEKNLFDLRNNPYFHRLKEEFFKWEKGPQVRFVEEFSDEQYLVVGYLGVLVAEKLYYGTQKVDGEDLLEWIQDKYGSHPELVQLTQGFTNKIGQSTEMNPRSLGVVLPLTGKKAAFGKRVLLGIDTALKKISPENPITLHIEDSESNGAVGALRVKELVEREKCAAVIGGLFSDEATKEYLEAKKRGVLFISLSQIYLPKEEKNHLLLEIPGSIESQVYQVFNQKMLEKFGQKAALFYPSGPRGEAYVNEFWRKAKLAGIAVTGVQSFEDQNDYLANLKNLMGLEFKRERQEELEFYADLHKLEKHLSTRRIQTLKPQIDFDWIFIPSLPRETLQIVPTFAYLDANKLNIIGGPSWRSNSIIKESRRLGTLHFVGDNMDPSVQEFNEQFRLLHKKAPKLIEMRSYDAVEIFNSLISEDSSTSRPELDRIILEKASLKGITGSWSLKEGIWLKELASFELRRGNIVQMFEEELPMIEEGNPEAQNI
jgi:ABC-type branched-subunit amino acid transport system substrate-binding protein